MGQERTSTGGQSCVRSVCIEGIRSGTIGYSGTSLDYHYLGDIHGTVGTTMRVVKEISFDCAHILPFYDGKCARLHGHTYRLWVGVEGQVDPETGMVVDFKDVKKILESVVDQFDHWDASDTLENPTAENMANHLMKGLLARWEYYDLPGEIKFIRLYEHPIPPVAFVEVWR